MRKTGDVIPEMPEDFEKWLLRRYTNRGLTELGYRRKWLGPFLLHSADKEWGVFIRACEVRGLVTTHSARVGMGKRCTCPSPSTRHVRFTPKGKALFRAWRVAKELTQ